MVVERTGAAPDSSSDRTRAAVLIVGLFCGLTLLLTYPIWVHPLSTVTWYGSDTELFGWTLSWDVYALTHRPWAVFDANIFFPMRHTLAYSENLIGSALLAAPVLWLTGSPVAAINSVSLLTTLLCGLGAYVLARRLGVERAGAILSGIIFAFGAPRFLRLGQLHLAAVQWLPFGLAAWHAYLEDGRSRDLKLTAAFFTLQALSSGHGTVFLLVAMAGLFLYRLVTGMPLALPRRARDLGLVGLLLLAPTALVMYEYLVVQREVGLARTLDDWARTNLASFFASPSYVDRFFHGLAPFRLEPPQADLFPGYLPILLAPLAFLRRRTASGASGPRTGAALFYALLTLGTFWVSLPFEKPFGLWPYIYWLPGLNFIRVPARFTILTMLGLGVLTGLGFQRVSERLSRPRATLVGAVLATLLVAEFAMIPLQVVDYRGDIPAVDRRLAMFPKPFVVAEVPDPSPEVDNRVFERTQSSYILHSTAHWQKTVHGYSGLRPEQHQNLCRLLERFPDEASLKSLEDLGVTYVVAHTELYDPDEWRGVEKRIGSYSDRLKLEIIVGRGRIYSLIRSKKPAS